MTKKRIEWWLTQWASLPVDMGGRPLRYWQQLAYKTGKRHGVKYLTELDRSQPGHVLISQAGVNADR